MCVCGGVRKAIKLAVKRLRCSRASDGVGPGLITLIPYHEMCHPSNPVEVGTCGTVAC